jgi:hypothetical protein
MTYRYLCILSLFILAIGATALIADNAYAQITCSGNNCSRNMTVPFGGRVLSTQIPTVTCATTNGTAPVLLLSNLAGLASAGLSATDRNQNGLQKTTGVVGGIYRAIPLYTLPISSVTRLPLQQPKPGGWILGNQRLIPDISTCQTSAFGAPVPFPVVQTDNYGVSRPVGGLR